MTEAIAAEVSAGGYRRFDKQGELFYDQISALHKAVRGSDPDASLYWLCRMLDGGCDPRYIARRVLRMASEDIGNADPRALTVALEASEVYERLGSPEGELAIAQAVVFMACAAKSNAVYAAFKAAMADAQEQGTLEVPLRLRNAPTGLMKGLGYGKGYRYAHDEPDAFAAGETYFPDDLPARRYYEPVPRGLEIKIAEALAPAAAEIDGGRHAGQSSVADRPRGRRRAISRGAASRSTWRASEHWRSGERASRSRRTRSARHGTPTRRPSARPRPRAEDIAPLLAQGEALAKELEAPG